MGEECDARIRLMRPVNDTEIMCEQVGDHPRHRGTLRDYAYPGSATDVEWADDDRRSYRGEWPGGCEPGIGSCFLPAGHRGDHAE